MEQDIAAHDKDGVPESSGWFRLSSPDPADAEPTSLLLALPMWTFPYWYGYLCALTLFLVATSFKIFGYKAADFISITTIAPVFLWLPVFLFFLLIVKSRKFASHAIYLPILWIFLVCTMGLTQGAISSALSRAYSAAQ